MTTTEENTMRGIAPIKKEFLVFNQGQVINWQFIEDSKTKAEREGGVEPEAKRPKIDDRDLNLDGRKFKLRGQNKSKNRYKMGKQNAWSRGRGSDNIQNYGEPRPRLDKSQRICLRFIEQEGICPYGNTCDYSHDLYKIYKLNEAELFDPKQQPCHIYSTYGKCHFGVACLFSTSHTKCLEDKKMVYNLVDLKKWSIDNGRDNYIYRYRNKMDVSLQQKLRKRTFDFELVTKAMNFLYKADLELNQVIQKEENNELNNQAVNQEESNKLNQVMKKKEINRDNEAIEDPVESVDSNHSKERKIGAAVVDEFMQGRDFERKKVHFKDKLILAPLTTVGNLPFRRLCKKFQCDITVSEMSLSSALLNGNPSEWSHVKRHSSEDVFGVQITATHPEVSTKVVKILSDEFDLDFIDFNCGCPTEFIYQSGAGSGLMSRPSKLRKMIAGASMVSNVPITIKLRAGVQEDKNIAHNLIKSVICPFTSKYIGAITIHGRTRAQRYSKLADWDYINECGTHAQDIPVIGSGDCISWQGYYENLDKYRNVSGVMIARGALISPWLFTEIKERRTWDISSRERLEIIGDFAKFALDHWGSDATGLENSRKYLLEWLSFSCRYIPVGLLEVLPQKINQRPPVYKGRDELETLLSSPSASDWVKISEMFLGKVPDGFKFLPKHKANAYEASSVQG